MIGLDALVKEWAALLRLQDWDIEARYVHAKEMAAPEGHDQTEVSAQVSSDTNFKYARIRVLHRDELAEDLAPVMYDVEHVVVHELLHLRFPDTEDEVAINQTASALLTLKRRK
ncbi:MAG: hypothetical protein Q8P18_18305 [Pseudomonadota bacterium]|nr:hypothetical protein [Pseudomonadota bacterium]